MTKPHTQFPSPVAKHYVDIAEMYPIIREVLDEGGTFILTPNGNSMYPTIRNGLDKVTLVKAPEKLQKYDLPFYIRKNGQFVLHRVVSVEEDGTYTCCGDHQWVLEKGLKQEQFFGIVTEIVRNGKRITTDNPAYLRWVHFWVWFLPARKSLILFCRWVKWVFHLPKAAYRRLFKKK